VVPPSVEVSTLSVIIPTLNEGRHLGSLLSDIAAQTREPEEVLVVDAGSTDGTVAVARRFASVRLLEGEPPVARGRNLGGGSAAGDVLIFLDADVRLNEGFFEGLLREFARHRLDVACPVTSLTVQPRWSRVSTPSSTRCSGSPRACFLRARDTASR
jgi:glycosyltransferase involved in cell wall biosynthesis